ncbi:hypothetical protein K7432_017477, partial [Basidiobolus ranarum]
PTEATTEAHKPTEATTEAHKPTEATTEAHKPTEATTEAPKPTEAITEAHEHTPYHSTVAISTLSCIPTTVRVTRTATFTAASVTPSNVSGPTSSSCTEGAYKCVDSGVSQKFTICVYGKLVENICAVGTVCKTFNDSILCDWA